MERRQIGKNMHFFNQNVTYLAIKKCLLEAQIHSSKGIWKKNAESVSTFGISGMIKSFCFITSVISSTEESQQEEEEVDKVEIKVQSPH